MKHDGTDGDRCHRCCRVVRTSITLFKDKSARTNIRVVDKFKKKRPEAGTPAGG
jgi:hypothetical protein